MIKHLFTLAFGLLLPCSLVIADEPTNSATSNIWDGAFDSDQFANKLRARLPEAPENAPITPATASTSSVAIFGTPDVGGYSVVADRDAALSVAQDALNSGNWDEVVVMRPVISADGTSYELVAVEGLEKLDAKYFQGMQLGMNSDATGLPQYLLAEESEIMNVGLFGRRGGSRRQFNDCNSCYSGQQQNCAPGYGACAPRGQSYGNCQGGDCNLRPLHIFANQFKYAFRRAYAPGERPGLRNRFLNFIAPRIRYRNGHISCHTAQTLLARRLILIEVGVIAGTAGAGGGAAGLIFIP